MAMTMKTAIAVVVLVVMALSSVQAVHMRRMRAHKKLTQLPDFGNLKTLVDLEGSTKTSGSSSQVGKGFCLKPENFDWCAEIRSMNHECLAQGGDRDLCITLYNDVREKFTAWCLIPSNQGKCKQLHDNFNRPVFRPPTPTKGTAPQVQVTGSSAVNSATGAHAGGLSGGKA